MICIREIDGKYYVYNYVEKSNGSIQVMSVRSDSPKDGAWYANGYQDDAVKYVARPLKSYKSAYNKARRECINRIVDFDSEKWQDYYGGVK